MYLLCTHRGNVWNVTWLTQRHFVRADAGELKIVNPETREYYARGTWRRIPGSQGDPHVVEIVTGGDD